MTARPNPRHPRRRAGLGVLIGLFALLAGCVSGEDSGDSGTIELRLDYAYYNLSSLVIKDQGWLEDELADEDVKVTWVLSQGSNKANENLRNDAIDIGSTAGTPALLARANGSPIKTIDIYSQPEWSAIVVTKDSPITSVEQLAGKKVAATKGTDPYFFLLQSIKAAGLAPADVEVVNLQHADGKTALERGDVDAWAGLDPHMAQTQLEQGSKLIYRNLDFNSYGFLNANESFLEEHPDLAQTVVDAYEKARAWVIANHAEAVQILADSASIPADVAELQISERTNIDVDPVPGPAQQAVLENIVPLLVDEDLVRTEAEVNDALDTLLEPTYAEKAVANAAAATTATPTGDGAPPS